MTLLAWTITLFLVNYLIGGIPFGWLLGRMKGIDVRKSGSGNIGAANVGRLLGRPWGIAVFVLDTLKGLLPTLVAGQWIGGLSTSASTDDMHALAWIIAGISAILGHNYSPYLGFRGGKGVATSLGVALGFYPDLTIPALLAFGVWIVCVAITRMSSVGSICAAVSFPLFFVVLTSVRGRSITDRWPFLAFALLTCFLVVVRHRANIKRILSGTEARLGKASAASESSTATPE